MQKSTITYTRLGILGWCMTLFMVSLYATTSHEHHFSNLNDNCSASLTTLTDVIIHPGDDVIFTDGDVAIIAAQGMNCGSMVYDFFDPGGENTAYSDPGVGNTLEFTVCPEDARRQLLSFAFQALSLDNETLSVYDGNNSNSTTINTYITGQSPNFQAGDSGTPDGSGCLTFVLDNFDGAGEPNGFEAVITSAEFAHSLSCLPFQELDGSGVSLSQSNNGSVDLENCNSSIPVQSYSFSVGCSIVDNAFYSYTATVNGMPLSGTGITSNPQPFTIPSNFLQIGNNDVEVEILYNGNTSIDVCTTSIPVNPSQAFTCNDDLNIGIDTDCSAFIRADVLLEGTCEEVDNYEITARLERPNPNFMDPKGITNPDDPDFISTDGLIASEQGTNNITLRVPGEYSYIITLGSLTCSGVFTLEDKRGPICAPNGDMETPIFYDSNGDQIIDEDRQDDPSGVDDLASEYILCSVLEEAAQQPYGIDIFFDKLEGTNGFEDYDGDGEQDLDEPSFTSDFLDCTGIRTIFFDDDIIEICELTDLNGIPVDVSKYDINRFEITTVYSRTWFAIDNQGVRSPRGCTQYIFALRPKADQIIIDFETTADCGDDIDSFCFQQSTAPYFQISNGIVNQGLGSGRTNNETLSDLCAGRDATIPASDKVYFLPPGSSSCNYSVSLQQESLIPICHNEAEEATSYKTIRHYTILNWCDGDRVYDEFTSLIKVEDTTPPALQTPEGDEIVLVAGVPSIEVEEGVFEPYSILLGSDFFECEAAGSLPLLSIIDNCSATTFDRIRIERVEGGIHDENVVVSQFVDENGVPANGGSLTNIEYADGLRGLPLGLYDVTYFFSDDCGNATKIVIPLTFEDNQRPQPICNDELIVTLVYGGSAGDQAARIYGEDLDDTSSDGCYPIILELRRVDQPDSDFAPFVEFDCTDISEEGVQVELKITEDRDGDGRIEEGDLSNRCWGRVKIEDKTPPTIAAENAVYICTDIEVDALILEPGTYTPEEGDSDFPTFLGGCSTEGITIDILTADVSGFDPICGVGIFKRTFQATRIIRGEPILGNIVEQTISVSFNSDWSMVFPTDVMVTCDDTVPSNLDNVPPPLRIEQIIQNNGCDQWGMEVKDEIFDVIGQDGDGACFKVIRTYKFINWCTWDPNNSETGVVPRPLDFFLNTNLAVSLDYVSDPVMNICNLQNKIDDANERNNDIYDIQIGNNNNGIVDLLSERDADFIFVDESALQGGDASGDGDCIEDGFNAIFDTTVSPSPENQFISDDQNHNLVSAEAYGYFLYRQVIKVIDNEAPVIQPIETLVVCDSINVNGNCTANITIAPPIVEECKTTYRVFYEYDQNNDDSIDLSGELAGNAIDGFASIDISGVPYGEHSFRYIVEDGCGNNALADFAITTRDCKAPTTYCKLGVNLDLTPTGTVTLWASDIDAGSTDDCSNPVQVSFSTNPEDTSRVFTCNELGTREIMLFTIDAAGNSSSCTAIVGIQSDNPTVECGVGGLIGGTIMTEVGSEVANAMVYLSGYMNSSVPTTVTGGYNFDQVTLGGDYTLTPEKNYAPLNGVSTFDLIVLRKHILGSTLLDSPYKMIAADINQSGTITTVDMIELRKLILGITDNFENNTSWKFVDANFEFPDPNNPWASAFPEYINYNDFSSTETNSNFVAIKIGDINASAIPNDVVDTDERDDLETWNIQVNQEGLIYDDIVTIPVTGDDLDITGYQFTLNFDTDALELLEIKEGAAKADNFGTTQNSEGIITTSWNGTLTTDETLFSLVFRAKTEGQLSEFLSITSDFTQAEAYNSQEEILDINLNFVSPTNSNETVALLQNQPNPFITQTTISFHLNETEAATLSIYDVTGKLLKQFAGIYSKGYQQVEVSANDLGSTGVLYYTLETTTTTITRKMILLAK